MIMSSHFPSQRFDSSFHTGRNNREMEMEVVVVTSCAFSSEEVGMEKGEEKGGHGYLCTYRPLTEESDKS